MEPQIKNLYSQNVTIRFNYGIDSEIQEKNQESQRVSWHLLWAQLIPIRQSVPFDIIFRHDFRKAAILEHQNLQLQNNKMVMYENEQAQNTMGHNLAYQGQILRSGFDDHRKMREEA